jgi:low temperature requirement protein LtrA
MTSNDAAGWLRQGETLQRSTLIELFFDLAFVYGMTQLSATLAKHLTWANAYQVLVLTMAVWWTWSVTTWATDLYAQKAGLRALVIALMFGVLLLSTSVPHAFDQEGLAFAASYVVLQMSRTSVLLLATRKHPLRKRPARVLTWFAVSAFLWIPGAMAHGTARVALWTAAVVVDYGSANLGWPTPWLGRSALSEWDVVEEHMAERYRQILIIGLGDMILTMGQVYTEVPPRALHTLALATSFLTTVVMWQIYSFRAGERITTAFTPGSSRARPARKLDWDHLVMVGGVVVSAVGAKLVIAHPSGHTPWGWIAAIVGGPALFLAGRVHFGHVVFGQLSMPRVFGLAALGALLPVLRLLPPILVSAVTVAVLLAVISPDLPELWRPSQFTAPNIRMKHGHPPGATPTRTRPEPGPPSEHQPAPGDLSD